MGSHKPNHLLLPILLLALSMPGSARQSVHPASAYCNLENANLHCDYNGIEEPIALDRVESQKVEKVSIHNAKQVSISGTPCVSLELSSIATVTFILAHNCQKAGNLSLKVTDSKINIVPKYIVNLDMEGSYADWVVSDKQFQSISIVNSRVGTFNVSQPTDEGAIVRIEHSRINEFQMLNIKNNAQFSLINTTIRILKENGIQLADARANIWMSNIQSTAANAINLGSMARLNLKDVTGNVMLSGPTQQESNEPYAPGVPPPKHIRRPSRTTTSPWAWIIPTGIAMLEAMVIMVNCTNWFPGLKSKPARTHRPDEEGIKDNPSGQYYNLNSQSSVFFSSEGGDVNKRKVGKDS